MLRTFQLQAASKGDPINKASSNFTRRGKPGYSTDANDILLADQEGHGGLNHKYQVSREVVASYLGIWGICATGQLLLKFKQEPEVIKMLYIHR
jgi:hypothetical protein